jgi:hypothetical protein
MLILGFRYSDSGVHDQIHYLIGDQQSYYSRPGAMDSASDPAWTTFAVAYDTF